MLADAGRLHHQDREHVERRGDHESGPRDAAPEEIADRAGGSGAAPGGGADGEAEPEAVARGGQQQRRVLDRPCRGRVIARHERQRARPENAPGRRAAPPPASIGAKAPCNRQAIEISQVTGHLESRRRRGIGSNPVEMPAQTSNMAKPLGSARRPAFSGGVWNAVSVYAQEVEDARPPGTSPSERRRTTISTTRPSTSVERPYSHADARCMHQRQRRQRLPIASAGDRGR